MSIDTANSIGQTIPATTTTTLIIPEDINTNDASISPAIPTLAQTEHNASRSRSKSKSPKTYLTKKQQQIQIELIKRKVLPPVHQQHQQQHKPPSSSEHHLLAEHAYYQQSHKPLILKRPSQSRSPTHSLSNSYYRSRSGDSSRSRNNSRSSSASSVSSTGRSTISDKSIPLNGNSSHLYSHKNHQLEPYHLNHHHHHHVQHRNSNSSHKSSFKSSSFTNHHHHHHHDFGVNKSSSVYVNSSEITNHKRSKSRESHHHSRSNDVMYRSQQLRSPSPPLPQSLSKTTASFRHPYVSQSSHHKSIHGHHSQSECHHNHQSSPYSSSRSSSRSRSRGLIGSNSKHENYSTSSLSYNPVSVSPAPALAPHASSNDDEERAGEYTSICLKNLDEKMNPASLHDLIVDEFKLYGKLSVKLAWSKRSTDHHSYDELIAFVNFTNHLDAKLAKRAKMNEKFCGQRLFIEAVFSKSAPNHISSTSSISPPHHQHNRPHTQHHYHHSQLQYELLKRPSSPSRYSTPSSSSDIQRHHHHQQQQLHGHTHHTQHRHHNELSSWPSSSNRTTPPPLPSSRQKNSPTYLFFSHRSRQRGGGGGGTESPMPLNYYYQKHTSSTSPSRNIIYKTGHHSSRSRSCTPPCHYSRSPPSAPVVPTATASVAAAGSSSIARSPPPSYSTDAAKQQHRHPHHRNEKIILEYPMNSSVSNKRSRSPKPRQYHHRHQDSRPTSSDYHRRSMLPPPNPISYNKRSLSNERTSGSSSFSTRIKSSDVNRQKNKNRTPSLSPPRYNSNNNNNAKNKKISRYTPPRTRSPSPSTHLDAGGVSHYFDNDERDATRTLFVGNLDNDIERDYLKRLFERHGIVEEIDIKRNLSIQAPHCHISKNSKTYAFIKYENMDMAIKAKNNMNGKRLNGKNECKIGYGKVQATTCLWIGGLNENSRRRDLERLIRSVSYYPAASSSSAAAAAAASNEVRIKIDWKSDAYSALVLFDSVKYSDEARYRLRGKTLANLSSRKLRIDFADSRLFDHSLRNQRDSSDIRRSSPNRDNTNNSSNIGGGIKRERSRSRSRESSKGHPLKKRLNNSSPVRDSYRKRVCSPDNMSRRVKRASSPVSVTKHAFLNGKLTDKQPAEARLEEAHESDKKSTKSEACQSDESSQKKSNDDELVITNNDCSIRRVISSVSMSAKSTKTVRTVYRTSLSPKGVKVTSPPNGNGKVVNELNEAETKCEAKGESIGEKVAIKALDDQEKVVKVDEKFKEDILKVKHHDEDKAVTNILESTIEVPINEDKKIQDLDKKIQESTSNTTSTTTNSTTTRTTTNSDKKNSSLTTNIKEEEQKKETSEKPKETSNTNGNRKSPAPSSSVSTKTRSRSPREKLTNKNLDNQQAPTATHQSSLSSSNQKPNSSQVDTKEIVPPQETPNNEQSAKNLTTKLANPSALPNNSTSSLKKPLLLNENLINSIIKDHMSKIGIATELKTLLTKATWSGNLTLKKHTFPTNFYLLAGSSTFSEQILPHNSILHINQRLRLDSSKLEDIERRLYEANFTNSSSTVKPKSENSQFSVFLSLPVDSNAPLPTKEIPPLIQNQQRSLNNLIYYLDQKSAAGVIPMPDDEKPIGTVHVFTPSANFSARILKQILPNLKLIKSGPTDDASQSDFLIVVILKLGQ